MPLGAYFLPSYDYFGLIVLPSLIAVGVGVVLLYMVTAGARRLCGPRVATVLAVGALCLFLLIGLKGAMTVAGFDWPDRVPHRGDLVAAQRIFKLSLALILVAIVWVARGSLPKLNRALASLGFGFFILALIRLAILIHSPSVVATTPGSQAASTLRPLILNDLTPSAWPRRVVWVIFDETDFGRLYGDEKVAGLQTPNFDWLSHSAVFAGHANSPASATLFSIPSLLTGSPINGTGLQIDAAGRLAFQSQDKSWVPFNEASSIFGAVTAGGRKVSALGYFHPYCKLFVMQRCDSLAWPQVGGLDAAFWANIPGILSTKLGRRNYWDAITERSIQLLPEYLARDDALTFVHLVVPHLPAAYAEKTLHFPASSDPLIAYSHNLMFADQVLGTILQTLRDQSQRFDVLLVVSTDHWLRNGWYRPNVRESSRPVPLIMWKVGETQGIVLQQSVSTVHTANMILSFLDGEIGTQVEIAKWWANQPVFPSFIAPNT